MKKFSIAMLSMVLAGSMLLTGCGGSKTADSSSDAQDSTTSTSADGGTLRMGTSNIILSILNAVCKLYLTVIRGTPMMVQLLIMGFVIMVPKDDTARLVCGIVTLGINSGAYVAEIVRGGLMSVNPGQMEAGRSLGLNYAQTMRLIVIPQAIKNILPALGNEMITLLKDTSLVSVIALRDVTKQAQNIVSNTYQAYVPYVSLAIIYLVLVIILTKLLGIFERRLRESDRR